MGGHWPSALDNPIDHWKCRKCGYSPMTHNLELKVEWRGETPDFMHVRCPRCGFNEFINPLDHPTDPGAVVW